MRQLEIVSSSYNETLSLAGRFAKALKKGDVICLFGDLGAGKTVFVKGLAKGLGLDPHKVHSPTFTLMNIYDGKMPLYHFDLYRIKSGDLFDLGYEEFFYGQGVAAIEWSERLDHLTPDTCWKVSLKHSGEEKRTLTIGYDGESLAPRFNKLSGDWT